MELRSERARVAVPVGGQDHVQGVASTETTLVEYGDFECPYTRRARPVVRGLRREFGDRLLFVFRNFPHKSVTKYYTKRGVDRGSGHYYARGVSRGRGPTVAGRYWCGIALPRVLLLWRSVAP